MRPAEDREPASGCEVWQEINAVCYQLLVKIPGRLGSLPAKRWMVIRINDTGDITMAETVKPR